MIQEPHSVNLHRLHHMPKSLGRRFGYHMNINLF